MKRVSHIIIITSCILSVFLKATVCMGQDPKIGDSLESVYEKKGNNLPDTAMLELLRQLSFNDNNPNLALKYNHELIDLAIKLNNSTYLYYGYYQLGNKKRYSGDYPGALGDYLKSSKLAKTDLGAANSYLGMADVYNVMGNYLDAKSYYTQGINLLRKLVRDGNDSVTIASAVLNEGEAFRKNSQYDSAMICGKEALSIFDKLSHRLGKAYAVGNIGLIYASLGKISLAEKNINEAVAVMEEYQVPDAICEYLSGMADIELQKGDTSKAVNYAKRSFDLAQKYQLKKQASDGSGMLALLYEKLHDPADALRYYKTYIVYRDSLNDVFKQRSVDSLQRVFEVSGTTDKIR